MKTVYFVRHGSTAQLEAAAYQNHDVPLSALGMKQGEVVAERFATVPVDVIFSSAMARAEKTAQKIAEAKKLPVEPLSVFNEILRPSAIRGKMRDDPVVARIFAEVKEYFSDPSRRHSDEENFYDLKTRALEALAFLESRAENRILVVTHGVFLKMVLGAMMFGDALSAQEHGGIDRFFFPSNTGITKCVFKDGRWRLMTWNDDAHLGELSA
jgi:broad specificity phosphatase PhoE